jgi:ankyrin repeat protein
MINFDNENKDLEDTIVDNEFMEPILKDSDYESKPGIISFITEYMSLSLNERIARYLINKKIRNIKNPITLDSLMHYLCINDENFPLLQLIKPNSTEIEQKNKAGQTLLHIAIQNKSYKIIKYLLENGANIQCKDNKNNTPLHIAVKKIDYNIVQLLMKYNPKLNILNTNNETPLDIAKRINDRKIINLLINNNRMNNQKENVLSELNNNCNINESKRYLMQNENKNKGKGGDKSTKSNIYNSSVNNCSLDTKNDTDYQSVNVYKKKIISKDYQNIDEREKQIRGNKTINLIFNCNKNKNDNATPCKNNSYNSINRFSPITYRTRLIYRKTSPKVINKNDSYFDAVKEVNKEEYEPYIRHISPGVNRNGNMPTFSFNKKNKNQIMINESNNNNNIMESNAINSFKNSEIDIRPKMKIIQYGKLKNKNNNNINTDRVQSLTNNYTPIIFKDYESNNYEIKKVRKTVINNTPFVSFGKNNGNLNSEKLLEFLKEIGMQQYGNILIAEGFDDINLIIKQMNEGFPILDDTLKEIGISCPGDRAKILIRMQDISDGFDFDFPFEQVFFKNNRSIQKWLNKEGLQQYIPNFIDSGYQSLELLLIQMASKYKMNDKILKNELNILNDEDRKKILSSLETNSKKYVYQLMKNKNVERTYSKMVQKNTDSFCIII